MFVSMSHDAPRSTVRWTFAWLPIQGCATSNPVRAIG
jgi:hypothetical protein